MRVEKLLERQAQMRVRAHKVRASFHKRGEWSSLHKGYSQNCIVGDHELKCPKLNCKCPCHADEYGFEGGTTQ